MPRGVALHNTARLSVLPAGPAALVSHAEARGKQTLRLRRVFKAIFAFMDRSKCVCPGLMPRAIAFQKAGRNHLERARLKRLLKKPKGM